MSSHYLLHGLTLTLAWFLATNVAISVFTAGAALLAELNGRKRSARFWMTLRLAPAAAATLFVAALFVPSYWKYEPRQSVEAFDLSFTLVASAGAVILAAAARRAIFVWATSRRRVNTWMAHARPITMTATMLPAYVVDVDQPMLALVGVLRPRLLATRGLLDVLTPAELEAAVAHEVGHQHSFDNLKRLLMAATPDCLTYFHAARLIERRWAAAAEHIADRISGPDTVAARCALASALVKVARLTPAAIGHAEPISTLIAGGDLASRVQRLLNDDESDTPTNAWPARVGFAGACAVVGFAAYGPLLQSVHEVTEILVRSLP